MRPRRDCWHADAATWSIDQTIDHLVLASRADPLLRQLVENVEHELRALRQAATDG